MELKELRSLANDYLLLESEISDQELRLSSLKNRMKELQFQTIPDAFTQIGVDEVKFEDRTLSVKPFYSAKCNTDAAFEWLEANGFGGLIKSNIVLQDTEENRQLLKDTRFTLERSVHPSTLKAFVREQVEAGKNIPTDIFELYIGMQAKLK